MMCLSTFHLYRHVGGCSSKNIALFDKNEGLDCDLESIQKNSFKSTLSLVWYDIWRHKLSGENLVMLAPGIGTHAPMVGSFQSNPVKCCFLLGPMNSLGMQTYLVPYGYNYVIQPETHLRFSVKCLILTDLWGDSWKWTRPWVDWGRAVATWKCAHIATLSVTLLVLIRQSEHWRATRVCNKQREEKRA